MLKTFCNFLFLFLDYVYFCSQVGVKYCTTSLILLTKSKTKCLFTQTIATLNPALIGNVNRKTDIHRKVKKCYPTNGRGYLVVFVCDSLKSVLVNKRITGPS